jgi:PAS domain S-box-containing protein
MTPPENKRQRPLSTRAAFEAIAESIPHIVWLADVTGSTDYFNERGTEYTGLARQANYGWKWLELVHHDDVERARTGWDHATRTPTPFELSYRIRRSDGAFRWHAFRALPVRGPSGAIMRWIGTADELTQHVRPADDDARVGRQVRQLQAMLQVMQPGERDRFGFVHPAERAARVDSVLRSTDGASDRAREVDRDAGSGAASVTPREVAVGRLIASGYTNAEIANLLGLSLRSIETSRARLRQTLDLRTRAEIVRFFRESALGDDRSAPLTADNPQP